MVSIKTPKYFYCRQTADLLLEQRRQITEKDDTKITVLCSQISLPISVTLTNRLLGRCDQAPIADWVIDAELGCRLGIPKS